MQTQGHVTEEMKSRGVWSLQGSWDLHTMHYCNLHTVALPLLAIVGWYCFVVCVLCFVFLFMCGCGVSGDPLDYDFKEWVLGVKCRSPGLAISKQSPALFS